MSSPEYAVPPDNEAINLFNDATIRRGFIRKVYSLLMVQLTITFGFIAWFTFHEPTKKFVQENDYLVIIALILLIVFILVLVCVPNLRRKSPANLICLLFFTIIESFLLGTTASFYDAEEVMIAVGITVVLCVAITAFAFQTKIDFTIFAGVLLVLLMVMLCFGFLMIFFYSDVMIIVYSSLGALIFGIYLIVDTQMIIGGKHRYQCNPEEYIFATLNLYLDIINMFMFILRIVGVANN